MSYLKGTGTSTDPFVIHNAAAFNYWLSNHAKISSKIYYAVLVDDIAVSGGLPDYNYRWYGKLNGFGRKITGLNHAGDCELYGSIEQCELNSCLFGAYTSPGVNGGVLRDIVFSGACRSLWRSYNGTIDRILFSPDNSVGAWSSTSIQSPQSLYQLSGVLIPGTGVVDLRSANKSLASNYPALTNSPSIWIVDGYSVPRLMRCNVSTLTQSYAVKGVTKVSGVAKKRKCRAHSSSDFYAISSTESDDNGAYILNCGLYSDHVYITHSDEYGKKFAPSISYVVGDVIHPSIPNGYRYICTTADTSAATEPTNWPTAGSLTSGGAIFTAQPVYKPETFIAVPVLIDLVTGLPV
jgi:hypothetical protein